MQPRSGELKNAGDVFLLLTEAPEPDEPPQVQIQKTERNQKLWADLHERELQGKIRKREHAARVQARRQRKAIQEWEGERKSGRFLRSAAWIVLLAGLLYVPTVLAGGDPPISWDSIVLALAWCLFGVVGAMEFFGGGLMALLVLFVLPYWLLGPIFFLYMDWFWGALSRPIPPPVMTASHISDIHRSQSPADIKARALMEEELLEHLKSSWRRDFGDLSQRSWDIELDIELSAARDATARARVDNHNNLMEGL